MTTTNEITDRQIRQLRDEAIAHGDDRQAALCAIALAALETANDDGTPLVDFDGRPITRTEARARCAKVISDAREAAS